MRIIEIDRITDEDGDVAWRVNFFTATRLLTPQELGRALTAVIQHLGVAYGHSEYEIMSEIVDILMGKTEAPPPKIEYMKLTEHRGGISLGGTTDVELCPLCHQEKGSTACRMLHG